MFNIGGAELLVIFVVALIVLGPQRLPGAARSAGKALGELRRLSTGFQAEMRSAFEDVQKPATPPDRVPPTKPAEARAVPPDEVAPQVADALGQIADGPASPSPSPSPDGTDRAPAAPVDQARVDPDEGEPGRRRAAS